MTIVMPTMPPMDSEFHGLGSEKMPVKALTTKRATIPTMRAIR